MKFYLFTIPAVLLILLLIVFGLRSGGHHAKVHSHDGSVLSIDQIAYSSKLIAVNPFLKFAFTIILLIGTLAANNIYVNIMILLITMTMIVVLGGISLRQYFSLMLIPILFLITGSIVILFDFSGSAAVASIWSVQIGNFFISITQSSLKAAEVLWARVFSAVSCLYMLSLSTPTSELIEVLARFHVPNILLDLTNMIYRFIFIMLDTNRRMKNAAVSRLGYRDYRTSLKSFGFTAGNLLMVSLNQASTYYDALEARGYAGRLRFLEEKRPVKTYQVLICIAIFLYLILLWEGTR